MMVDLESRSLNGRNAGGSSSSRSAGLGRLRLTENLPKRFNCVGAGEGLSSSEDEDSSDSDSASDSSWPRKVAESGGGGVFVCELGLGCGGRRGLWVCVSAWADTGLRNAGAGLVSFLHSGGKAVQS